MTFFLAAMWRSSHDVPRELAVDAGAAPGSGAGAYIAD
jgi:hypothetical protein